MNNTYSLRIGGLVDSERVVIKVHLAAHHRADHLKAVKLREFLTLQAISIHAANVERDTYQLF